MNKLLYINIIYIDIKFIYILYLMNFIDNTDYKCGMINNMNLSENIINEFKENYIYNDMWDIDSNELLINNFNKLFIMVLYLTEKNKDKLSKILSNEYFETINNNGGLIVGFIKIQNARKYIIQNKNFWYIDLIDTRLSKQHIARIMIYKLKILKKRQFVPLIIAKYAISYWIKFFFTEYGLTTKEQIEIFIIDNKITKHNNWNIIYDSIKY